MNKLLCIAFLVIASHVSAIAYELKTDTVIIEKDNYQITQLIVSVINNESKTLWVWFDELNLNQKDACAIKTHLMKREADFSLFDIATDANMSGCLWCDQMQMSLFVKCIEPWDSFMIVIYKESEVGERSSFFSIDFTKYIRIYNNDKIVKQCPGIDSRQGIKRISYPYHVITLNEQMMKSLR